MISSPLWTAFLWENFAHGHITPEIYRVTQAWFSILAILLDTCVTLGKLHSFRECVSWVKNEHSSLCASGLIIF